MTMTTAQSAQRLPTGTGRAIQLLLILLFVIGMVTSPWAVGTASAQEGCADPGSDCSGSQEELNGILDSLFTVVYEALKYIAFVAVVAGGILYVTASNSTSRGRLGVSMFWGGIALIILYFGFAAIVGALEFIASGGGG
jgi:hypothetical protein